MSFIKFEKIKFLRRNMQSVSITFTFLILLFSCFTISGIAKMDTIYDLNLKLTDIDKKTVNLSDFKGKVVLIVNVASKCGFTPQYEGLEKLYKKYKSQGFEIFAFPCNQFGNQEPGSNEEIKNFCTTKYNVSFKLFDKIEVNGPNTHPLYKFLKQEKPGMRGTPDIKWNFTKFLIDRNGIVVERYAPQTSPESIEKDIVKLLTNH